MTESELEAALRAHYQVEAERTSALAHYAAGELSAPEKRGLEASLTEAERAQLTLFETLVEPPRPQSAVGPSRRRAGRRIWTGLLLAAAAGLALMLLSPSGHDATESPDDEFLVKGRDWQMQVGVRRGDATFRLQPGVSLRTGDELGFFLSNRVPGYAAIFYADRSGEIVRLFPPPDQSGRVEMGEAQSLAAGAKLTEGEGCEWVVAYFAQDALDLKGARKEIAGKLPSVSGCRLTEPRLERASVSVHVVER